MTPLHPAKLFLALLSIPIAAASAWLCAAVAKYGVHLDPSGVNALAVAGAAGAIGLTAKLIHDIEARHPSIAKELAIFEAAAADVTLTTELENAGKDPAPALAAAPASDASSSSSSSSSVASSGWPPA